jgi:uncharacterized membrane protein
MLPNPLHPAVVHFPIALAVLAPALALGALVAIRLGRLPARAWAAVVLLQALLVGSGWLALETGEREEDRVEDVVAEARIEAHEAAAERFLAFAAGAAIVSAAGLLRGRLGRAGRLAGAAASGAALAAAVAVGHSGGELVYRYGAATAYVERAQARSPTPHAAVARREHADDD